jgi:hypothetical protein
MPPSTKAANAPNAAIHGSHSSIADSLKAASSTSASIARK